MSTYNSEAQDILDSLKNQTIKILVWGPGDPGENASDEKQKTYKKRLQIRDVLRTEFPRAEVYFSEDPEMISITEGISGQLLKQAFQARISDLIIMLDISRGVDLELDHFVPTYSWFRDKVVVFIPERYVKPEGLAKAVFDYLREEQIIGFSVQEFKLCKVATIKAVKEARTTAMAIFLHPSK